MTVTQFFTISFSTFFGAAVALLGAMLTRAHDARLAEESALNNLILDLAAKRAFVVTDDWDWADGEIGRVVSSVFHARSLIREARVQLRARSRALLHLRTMARSCNEFLELSEREDEARIKDALKHLTAMLTEEVAALHAENPRRLFADAPGSFALAPID
jgi:hypothetical protein